MKVTTTKRTSGTIEELAEAVRRTIAFDMPEAEALEVAKLVLGQDFQKDTTQPEEAEPVFFCEEVDSDTEA